MLVENCIGYHDPIDLDLCLVLQVLRQIQSVGPCLQVCVLLR